MTTFIDPDILSRRLYAMSAYMVGTMQDYGIDKRAMEDAIAGTLYSLQYGGDALLNDVFADTVTFCIADAVQDLPRNAAIGKADLLRKTPGLVDALFNETDFIVRSDAVGIGAGTIWFTFSSSDDALRRASIRLSTINIAECCMSEFSDSLRRQLMHDEGRRILLHHAP